MRPLLLLAAACSCFALAADTPKKFELTIENIMRGPGLVGYEPTAVRWSQDGSKVFFSWKQAADPTLKPFDTYVVNRDGTGLRKLTEDEARLSAPPAQGGDLSRDKKSTVYASAGDLYLMDSASGKARRITFTNDVESSPRFTRDSKRIAFVRNNNLYLMSLDSPMIEQLTDIRPAGSPPAEPKKGTESQEFLKKEERDILAIVRDRALRREEEEARRKKDNPRKPYILQGRQTVASLQLAPDEKHVLAMILEPAADTKTAIVPNFVSESAYTEDLQTRNKVGDVQARTRLAWVDVTTGDWKWVEHGLLGEDKKERAAQFTGLPVWSEDGTKAVFQVRSTDNKDRWIFALDPATAKGRELFHEHDDAWVSGGGFGARGTIGFTDSSTVYFLSEKSGYAQLYSVPFDAKGGDAKALTEGKFEVTDVDLSDDRKTFFLTTSEGSPFERHFYSMPVTGGQRTRLTTIVGNHAVTLSPDEKTIAEIFSSANKPPELYIAGKQVTDSPTAEFKQYKWIDPPIVEVPARDGAHVPARFYKPANFRNGGPAVIFVHGAGYLQNVHKWWSSYFREYMFHHFLLEQGFAVLDLDYRASAGYGRDWRTGIYRYMGGKDLDDQVDGAEWLIVNHGVDPKKIGIYGGSYGGFITLMALFTQPGVFSAGAALRPVTDWAHYNHPYTSNILNLPQKDAEAYRKSSPIYHAAGLKGSLLICHGMVDVNVHFQDSVRLVQKLIELGKQDWELAVYPVEDHGFVQPSSWTDEYRRIYKLFAKMAAAK
ncbi:MAG: prolyl oligopeptidase family serine peptidase [Acidobacteria bacterium]|nr:prolyl oligopeptidase family serine peptidase [Acidobacteriota bacterium]